MSLESLMQVKITSVARKSQLLSQTAAAVYVISGDDIRRSGLTSVPEVLRLAPGVQVARIDTSRWAIAVRGFNGEYSNKLLVLVDGRTVYTEIFSGVYWGMQDMLLEDIDHIEVIRGPGATMWGANAVNGVINIITKSSKETLGSMVSLTAGDQERQTAGFRYGGRAGKNTTYRLSARFADQCTPAPGLDRDTQWRSLNFNFRLDTNLSQRDSLSINATARSEDDISYRDLRIVTAPWFTRSLSKDDRWDASIATRWTRRLSSGEVSLQASFDDSHLNDLWRVEHVNTADIEFQHRFRLGELNEVTYGVGVRSITDKVDPRAASLTPPSLSRTKSNLFVQDEWTLRPNLLTLTGGIKFEHNYFTGVELEPSVRLLFTPTMRSSYWAAVSRAVRTPSRVDRGGFVPGFTLEGPFGMALLTSLYGQQGFVSEKLHAYELGWRRQFGPRVSIDSSWFFNRYKDLTGYRMSDLRLARFNGATVLEGPFYIENIQAAHSYGSETSFNLKLADPLRISGSYSWLRIHLREPGLNHLELGPDQTNFGAGNAPQHQGQVHADYDLGNRWTLSGAYYYNGSLQAMRVPAYSRLDTRLAWRTSNGTEVSFNGQNLTNRSHYEFLAESLQGMFPVRRSVSVRFTYWF